jgi:hypothetical protein
VRLLAHEDGAYEWVEPSDYRVAEIRLLHDVATVGTVGKRRAADNLLIRGDALHALTSLARLPEFAREYLGKVKLAYLDPPFNTHRTWSRDGSQRRCGGSACLFWTLSFINRRPLGRVSGRRPLRVAQQSFSNFQWTDASVTYGKQLAKKTGKWHFVIDTSRNGAGPYVSQDPEHDPDWCNRVTARPDHYLPPTPAPLAQTPFCGSNGWVSRTAAPVRESPGQVCG